MTLPDSSAPCLTARIVDCQNIHLSSLFCAQHSKHRTACESKWITDLTRGIQIWLLGQCFSIMLGGYTTWILWRLRGGIETHELCHMWFRSAGCGAMGVPAPLWLVLYDWCARPVVSVFTIFWPLTPEGQNKVGLWSFEMDADHEAWACFKDNWQTYQRPEKRICHMYIARICNWMLNGIDRWLEEHGDVM